MNPFPNDDNTSSPSDSETTDAETEQKDMRAALPISHIDTMTRVQIENTLAQTGAASRRTWSQLNQRFNLTDEEKQQLIDQLDDHPVQSDPETDHSDTDHEMAPNPPRAGR